MELKNKKVLLMGLGVLGGGLATARWLVRQGALLTITDIKDEMTLAPSLEKLKEFGGKIKYVLGRHEEKDFLENDIIVINPDVPSHNTFVEIARKAGRQIENELTLFYKFCPSKNIVAITGTRGKTTTVNWTAHLLKIKYTDTLIMGNSPDKPLLQEMDKCTENTMTVVEAPSFQLEICGESECAPHVAVITNLYTDHLNRHKTMENYAKAKANIFIHQKENDFLILNRDNEWTSFFVSQNPKSKILYFSEDDLIADEKKFVKMWGEHNLQNFVASSLVALTLGVPKEEIVGQIDNLPQIKFRQEKVFDNGILQIYNDTAATSPEALIAAMERFPKAMFISGGTDRELNFKKWGEYTKKVIKPEQLILLSGSATEKMKKELNWNKYNEFDTLKECLDKALVAVEESDKKEIVFSPGAKSFEKFKNEFDRGEQFNRLIAGLPK